MHKGVSILIVVLCCLAAVANAQYSNADGTTYTAIQGGIGLGTVIAVTASWSRNQSIGWAILHGILNWLYVIHFLLTRNNRQ